MRRITITVELAWERTDSPYQFYHKVIGGIENESGIKILAEDYREGKRGEPFVSPRSQE